MGILRNPDLTVDNPASAVGPIERGVAVAAGAASASFKDSSLRRTRRVPKTKCSPELDECDWVAVDLMDDGMVHVALAFFQDAHVTEKLTITRAERPRSGEHRIRFRFDRTFETSMTNCPDHLTPVAVLPLAQKLYYYLLSALSDHDVRRDGERYKIWPVRCDIEIPTLIGRATNVEGEIVEVLRRAAPCQSNILYPGIAATLVHGLLTIDKSMVALFECVIYDLHSRLGDA